MWFRKVIHTADDHALMLLRTVLGLVFFAHGAQKAFGLEVLDLITATI